MEFEANASPQGFCIFCDDIRHEVNNKQTYVGAYIGSELNILGPLPAVLYKFCIHVGYRQRITDPDGPVVFEVHMPGDDDDKPSARAEAFPSEVLSKLPAPAPDNDDPMLGIALAFEFSPLEIKREGRLRVSAVREGKRYGLGSLQVISRPPQEEAAN
ncbi:hypothetical protein [Bradyrhizobium sp. USDA 3256]